MQDTIELDGLTFAVAIEHDCDYGAPWDEEYGHGVISDWERRERTTDGYVKAPHERILCDDRGHVRVYDMRATMRKARAEGWGLCPDDLARLAKRLGRDPRKGDILAAAVDQDFERMRGWCNDLWHYVGVVVTLQDVDGNDTHVSESLWGIESDSDDYLESVAKDLAAEIARQVGAQSVIPARPASYQIRAE